MYFVDLVRLAARLSIIDLSKLSKNTDCVSARIDYHDRSFTYQRLFVVVLPRFFRFAITILVVSTNGD